MGLNYYKIKKHVRKARKLVIKGTTAAASGHPGGSFLIVSSDVKEGTKLQSKAISGDRVKFFGSWDDEKHDESSINSPLVTTHADDIRIVKKEAKFVSDQKDPKKFPYIEFMWKLEHVNGKPAKNINAVYAIIEEGETYPWREFGEEEYLKPGRELEILNSLANNEGVIVVKIAMESSFLNPVNVQPGVKYKAKIDYVGYPEGKAGISYRPWEKGSENNEISVKVPWLIVIDKDVSYELNEKGKCTIKGHFKFGWSDGSKFDNEPMQVTLVALEGDHTFGIITEKDFIVKAYRDEFSTTKEFYGYSSATINFKLEGSIGDQFTLRPYYTAWSEYYDGIVFGDKNLLHVTALCDESKIIKLDKSKTFVKPDIMNDNWAKVQFAFVDEDGNPFKDTPVFVTVNYTYPYLDGTYTETQYYMLEGDDGILNKTIGLTSNEAQPGVVYEVISVEDFDFKDPGFKIKGIEKYKVSVVDRRLMWDDVYGSQLQWQFKYDGYDKYVHDYHGACGFNSVYPTPFSEGYEQCNGFFKNGWWGLSVSVYDYDYGEEFLMGKVGIMDSHQIEYTGDGHEMIASSFEFLKIEPPK